LREDETRNFEFGQISIRSLYKSPSIALYFSPYPIYFFFYLFPGTELILAQELQQLSISLENFYAPFEQSRNLKAILSSTQRDNLYACDMNQISSSRPSLTSREHLEDGVTDEATNDQK